VTRGQGEGGQTDLQGYVDRCLKRPLIGAVVEDTLVGFLSFEQLSNVSVIEEYTPTNHVEIIAVDPEYRGQGLGETMYQYLLDELPSDHRQPFITTKTWDTNDAHIAILEDLGFDLVHRIPDDRGAGIDTVYYARSM
jgi:ribosomal protein S18 acetylase RimI-like enzyme